MVGTQAGDGDAIRDAFDSEDSGIRIQAVSTGTGTCTAVQPRTAYTVPVYTLPVLCTGSRSMINTQLPVFYMCTAVPVQPRAPHLARALYAKLRHYCTVVVLARSYYSCSRFSRLKQPSRTGTYTGTASCTSTLGTSTRYQYRYSVPVLSVPVLAVLSTLGSRLSALVHLSTTTSTTTSTSESRRRGKCRTSSAPQVQPTKST